MIELVKKLVGLGLLASALILEPAEAATPPPPASTAKPVTPATEVPGPLATREAAELITLFAAKTTADHSQLKPLQGPFHTGPEVTQACLKCHNQAGLQVMQSIHWTFEKISPTTGKKLGKRYAANNFCGSILSNEPRCTSCHAGYGWTDQHFDFTKQENVDCLACHDTTGTYKKVATDAGHPLYQPREMPPGSGKIVQPPDLTQIAQHVGRPCGGTGPPAANAERTASRCSSRMSMAI